jgi:hypothetical protein
MLNKYVSILLLLLIFLSCGEDREQKNVDLEIKPVQFSDSEVEALLNTKVFFGHMSVGFNIISGVAEIKKMDGRLRGLNIAETVRGDNMRPGIYHQRNGKNGYPVKKCDDFKSFLLKDGMGENFDAAFFKLCYVDFDSGTNVEKIFNYYKNTVKAIQKVYPNLTIIHATTPLHAHAFSFKSKLKTWVLGDQANVKRNQYNQLLLKEYRNIAPIYDIARVESTYPDGSRYTFNEGDEAYYALIREYTNDGGHLNTYGKIKLAEELLRVIAGLQSNNSEKDFTELISN